jgi:hypothetical protein
MSWKNLTDRASNRLRQDPPAWLVSHYAELGGVVRARVIERHDGTFQAQRLKGANYFDVEDPKPSQVAAEAVALDGALKPPHRQPDLETNLAAEIGREVDNDILNQLTAEKKL